MQVCSLPVTMLYGAMRIYALCIIPLASFTHPERPEQDLCWPGLQH